MRVTAGSPRWQTNGQTAEDLADLDKRPRVSWRNFQLEIVLHTIKVDADSSSLFLAQFFVAPLFFGFLALSFHLRTCLVIFTFFSLGKSWCFRTSFWGQLPGFARIQAPSLLFFLRQSRSRNFLPSTFETFYRQLLVFLGIHQSFWPNNRKILPTVTFPEMRHLSQFGVIVITMDREAQVW